MSKKNNPPHKEISLSSTVLPLAAVTQTLSICPGLISTSLTEAIHIPWHFHSPSHYSYLLLEFEGGYSPTLALSIFMSSWITPPIANWFWIGTSFELIFIAHCLVPDLYKNLTSFIRIYQLPTEPPSFHYLTSREANILYTLACR